MKINGTLSLIAIGIALATTSTWAQTTPTGTVSSSTIPQGAIAPDSTPSKAAARNQKRAMRQARRSMNQNSTTGTGNTTTQDAHYRQSSTSDGTAINNSNTTNYNSNNVTNAPTGAGSNPNTMTNMGNTTPDPTNTSRSRTNPVDSNAGSVEAVKGARTTEAPAVKVGTTVRNSSVGDFIGSSPNYTTLQNALQSSDLYEMLRGNGPYTLFAPTNSAFKKLPTTVQAGLLDGSHRDALKQLLSYHIVSGSLNSDELGQQMKAGNGKAQLKTLSGRTLTATLDTNGKLSLTDEQGNTIHVENNGNRQANGMVYGIDTVLMAKDGAASFR
ncbi:fasciclin domain-containing protein [Spirosoma panaciterrae]|uniref:fasciclin domain-containing protein n=1 Tax=Spirosoma panaciterrae TaxID=496058 RepID=UPI00037F52C3|nr:fasciclin domain-containing protein [Spirosoma panaciterrae]